MTDRQKNKKTAATPRRRFLVRKKPNGLDTEKGACKMTDILIVTMLAVLIAAAAGPRFTRAGAERRLPELVSNLHRMRCQIELYRIEHGGLMPGQKEIGDDVTSESFVNALTEPDSVRAEPYLREIPPNPFVAGDAADDITIVNCMDAAPCGDAGTGWWFNAATGEFRANDSRFHSVY